MARKNRTFEKAQASVLKAIRGFEKAVTDMVSSDPEPKRKPKKSKKTKNRKTGKGGK